MEITNLHSFLIITSFINRKNFTEKTHSNNVMLNFLYHHKNNEKQFQVILVAEKLSQ